MTDSIESILMDNRTSDDASDLSASQARFYIKNGLPYVRTQSGIALPVGKTAQFGAAAFALAIGATTVDFTATFNNITGLSFASHAFSVPAGIWLVEVQVDIDNTAQVTAGTYRKLELKQATTVVDYSITAPLATNMPAKVLTLVNLSAVTAMSVVFTHDAGHAIAGTFKFNVIQVG